ncbi:MAG: hypothetical protein QM711_02960 [Micropruina sp.]|uniref:hypothetical protein n=1 Tax=Micropruina sp. TaxID=2737536 RepID=UPI0039E23A3A
MKTTIELPDALADEARRLARETGTTLRELVISGLRHELRVGRETPRVDFVFPTFAGSGLVAELSPESVVARSYGLPG